MILVYHHVLEVATLESSVDIEHFMRQILLLRNKKVVYLDDYDVHDPMHCVITFDDGNKNIFNAVPILKRFGMPFEIFLVADRVEQAEKGNPHLLNRADLKTIVQHGGRLQYHSKTHPWLDQITNPQILDEEIRPDQKLLELDPAGFSWFAYPYCVYTPAVIECVKKYYCGARSGKGLGSCDKYTLDSIILRNHMQAVEIV